MNADEVSTFEANPFYKEAVQVHIWDEGGKEPDMQTKCIRFHTPMSQRIVDSNSS